MKKIIHVILLFFLWAVAFAQDGPPPPDFENPNDPNPTDQPSVPIDTHLILFSSVALFFGFYIINRKKHNRSN
jgi:hypothetical protein